MNSKTSIATWQEAKDVWGTLIHAHPECALDVGGVFRPLLEANVVSYLVSFFHRALPLAAYDKYGLGRLLGDADKVLKKSKGECEEYYNLLTDVILFALNWSGERETE